MYLLWLENVSHSGTCFHVDGKMKIDKYVFQREPGFHNRHLLRIPDVNWPQVRDDIIFEGQKAIVKIDYEIEAGSADKAVTSPLLERIANLDALLVVANGNLEKLGAKLNEARLELSEARLGRDGITQDQIAFLRERDAMLEILGPHADAEETPLQAITRICKSWKASIDQEFIDRTVNRDAFREMIAPPTVAASPEARRPYVQNLLQKKTLAQLQSIAGEFGITAPHEIKPAAKLIRVILEAQAAKLAA